MTGVRLAAMVAAALLCGAPASASVTIEIGGRVACEWWAPPWSDGARFLPPTVDFPASLPGTIGAMELRPGVMYGFIIAVRFLESWFFSSSFRYGNYFSRHGTPTWAAASLPAVSIDRKINRYDFNADIGYWFVRYAAVFVSVRTRSHDYVEKVRYAAFAPAPWIAWSSAKAEFIEAGPGLGVRLAVPIHGGLSLTACVVALALPGGASHAFDHQYRVIGGVMEPVTGRFSREGYHSFAGSFALGLAYRFDPSGVILGLGGRYEVARYTHHRIGKGFLDYGGTHDRAACVEFSAVYSVALGGEVKQ